jgi:hypothetical protein
MPKLATLGYRKSGGVKGYVSLDLRFFGLPKVTQQEIIQDYFFYLAALLGEIKGLDSTPKKKGNKNAAATN